MKEERPEKMSRRERGKEEEEEGVAKGEVGMPVNSWTMARKLDVSVVSTVVGARREARERFLELRGGGGGGSGGADEGLEGVVREKGLVVLVVVEVEVGRRPVMSVAEGVRDQGVSKWRNGLGGERGKES